MQPGGKARSFTCRPTKGAPGSTLISTTIGSVFEPTGKRIADCTTYLHGGAFAPKRHAAADGQHTAHQFDWQHSPPTQFAQPMQGSFQMGDTAPAGH
jgi:hypothetical protein